MYKQITVPLAKVAAELNKQADTKWHFVACLRVKKIVIWNKTETHTSEENEDGAVLLLKYDPTL